jgi:hypothetical protein
LSNQLISSINKTATNYSPEIQQHVERWRYPSVATTLLARSTETPSTIKWNAIVSDLINFANQRASKTRRQFMTYFALADTVKVTLNVNNDLMGKVKINSLYIDKYLIRNNNLVYPWTGVYFNGNPISLEAIAYPGYKFSHWNSINDTVNHVIKNVTVDTLVTAYFIVDTAFKPKHFIYINEVLASNTNNIKDDYFENEDWIELYNPNNFSVDISGFYLSDESIFKTKYRIKPTRQQTVIPPRGFKLIWLDSDTIQGTFHGNFKLNAASDSLFLTMPNGIQIVDSLGFLNQKANVSFGRQHDGDDTWITFSEPTPNSTNRIKEIPELDYFLVYPNPTSDILYFTQSKNVEIYDLLGKKILSLIQVKNVNVTSLAQGIYLLKTDDGQVVKFSKN